MLIALSSALAAIAAISRLIHPAAVSHLPAVAAMIGFIGSEWVARTASASRQLGSRA